MIADALRCSVQDVWRLPLQVYLRVKTAVEAEQLAPGYHRRTGEDDTVN